MWKPTISSDELYHHGILGQKWGKRNGPPYPLGSGQHSAAEKKAGWQKSLKGGSTSKKNVKGSVDAKNVNKQGNPALALFLAWDAFVFLSPILIAAGNAIDTNKAKKFRDKCDKDREAAETDKKTGLKLKANKEMSREEDAKRVNPDYKLNPGGARQNCTNCTMAYEMRRRGYEVEAQLKSSGRDGVKMVEDIFKAKNNVVMKYPDPKTQQDEFLRYVNKYEEVANRGKNKELAQKTLDAFHQQPPGSRGQMCITWNRWGGHSVAYEITADGKVNIIDGQIGKIFDEKQATKEYFQRGIAVQFQRLDNCKVDTKKVKETIR